MTNQTESDLRELVDELLMLVPVAEEAGDSEEVVNLLTRAAALTDRLEAMQGLSVMSEPRRHGTAVRLANGLNLRGAATV